MIRKVAKKTLSRLGLLETVKELRENKNKIAAPITEEVAKYYDKETDAYLGSYGTIIQAQRPTSDDKLVEYYSTQIGLKPGMHLLDAGCGIGGPAVALAQKNEVSIEGITISQIQVEKGRKYVESLNLNDRVNISLGDFANIDKIFPADTFDVVYFMESLGYAPNYYQVLQSAKNVLKSGGYIYIKDFFLTALTEKSHKKVQTEFAERVRKEYYYKGFVIHELIKAGYELGFYIEFIVPFGLQQDFSVANAFEEANKNHTVYSDCLRLPFQIYEALEVKFRKL